MRRRAWMAMTGAIALTGMPAVLRATADRPRIAVLNPGSGGVGERAILARLLELGWEHGRTATIALRAGAPPRMPALAAELAQMRPDLVIAGFDFAIRAAAQAMPDIPIVMAGTLDPIGLGWIASLREPGGRFTGTAWTQDPSMTAKYAEIMAEVVPGLRRLGALIDPTFPGIDRYRNVLEATVVKLGIEVRHESLTSIERLPEALAALAPSRSQALFVYGSPTSSNFGDRIAVAAVAARLPAVFIFRHVAEAGGLMSFGPSLPEISRRAVDFADRILRGANPATMPVEQPSRYEMVVNLKTANSMGIRVPGTVLARADEVLE